MNCMGMIWNKNKRPVEQNVAEEFRSAIKHRFRDLDITPLRNSQGNVFNFPSHSFASDSAHSADAYRISFHGNLYNRAEIYSALRGLSSPIDAISDAELVLLSYLAWGKHCVIRFEGEFAFAINDSIKNTVFCAKDIMGLKPLYYSNSDTTFSCASEPGPVLSLPDTSDELNENSLAALVSNRLVSDTTSLFTSIHRLAAGHHMTVSHGTVVSLERYYQPDYSKKIHYKNDSDYFEHLTELIENALKARCSVHSSIGTTLSGGIDSSAITGKLAQLSQHGEVFGFKKAYSMVFPGLSCDESRYINDVAGKWEIDVFRAEPDEFTFDDLLNQVMQFRDSPIHPHRSIDGAIGRQAKADGVTALVTGFGSDELFGGSFYHLADSIRHLNVKGLMDSRSKYGVSESDLAKRRFINFGIRPFVPSTLENLVLKCRSSLVKKRRFAPWLGERTIDLLSQETFQSTPKWSDYHYLSQASIQNALISPFMQQAIEHTERVYAQYNVVETHPFLDKSIIEFAFAIPEKLRWAGDENKRVVRGAMPEIIPDSILARTEKTEFPELLFNAIEGYGGISRWDNTRLFQGRWLNEKEFMSKMRTMYDQKSRGSASYEDNIWPIWCALSLMATLDVL